MEDQPPSANITRDNEYTTIPITEDEDEDHQQHFDGCQIHRVPDLLRFNKHNKDDYYTPKLVSFGPYYHSLPQLDKAEKFKHEVLRMLVSSSGKGKEFFYHQIFKVVDQIRNCYFEVSRAEYDDEALEEMMLLDACLAIYLMLSVGFEDIHSHAHEHLGIALLPFAIQDIYLLENQIPLWVIMLLSKLIFGNKEEGTKLLLNFLCSFVFGDINKRTRIPKEGENPPLHLLGAFQRILSQELDSAEERIEESTEVTKQNLSVFGEYNHQYRSVTDLKAKGIHFKPSSGCLKNIKFKSHTFYGQLQLPIWFFSSYSKLFFTHMIAYEVSRRSKVGLYITCYFNFLKSLIVKPEDVKELREKKVIFSSLDSDEQILEVIKEIDTCGVDADYIFYDVKKRIEDHCSSKAKTRIAELDHNYFRSPWTFIALLAATILLVLTFLQTYYTMNP